MLEIEENINIVTIMVANQRFGIFVDYVRDVLDKQPITEVPAAPKEVIGMLNLRGRIVTVLDLQYMLEIEKIKNKLENEYFMVVEYDNSLYGLNVDFVGDVMMVNKENITANPDNMSPKLQSYSIGILQHKDGLITILDIDKIFKSIIYVSS